MEGKKQTASYPVVDKALVEAYLAQLSALEKQTMKIAQEELKSSFCVEKSIGFLEWSASQ
jgi:hypothetical protein